MIASTGALLALQVAGTSLGFVSWWRVQEACLLQQRVGETREGLLELARASRELYVHQAHTFIEGGPGHLDHLREDVARVESALAAAGVTDGPFPLDTSPIREAVTASNLWFDAEVAPRARAGTLDRATAAALHGAAEAHAGRVQRAIDGALGALAAAGEKEVARVSRETRRAWAGIAIAMIAGLATAAVVIGRLAAGILAPVDALRTAVRAFSRGEAINAPVRGDSYLIDEIAELGRAFDDMVGRVQAAEERRVERERVQALGEIAGAVAHELMNPIAAILAETRADPVDGARIRAEADHARRVIQGLLGYARPGEAEPVGVRVDEAAAAAVERAIPFADARGLTVRWQGGAPITLHAAPTAVRQVLDNLIRNAIDASADTGAADPAGAPDVEVEVRGGCVEIRDRGAGIPDSVRRRLYEPFVTGRPDGTGLGLAVSQRIARALGGRIVHLDRAGGGTVARWEVQGG